MQEGQRASDGAVPQAGQPPGLLGGQPGQVAADHLHEHQLAQAQADTFAARPPLLRLRDRKVDEQAERIAGGEGLAHVEQARQRRQQRVEGMHVAAEEAAHETELLRAAATLGDGER